MKKKYDTNFSDEDLSRALHKNDSKAEEIVNNKDNWKKFKLKIDAFLEKARKIPVIGNVVDDILCMIEMVDLYVKDEYKDVPYGTVISIVLALIYVLSPIDLLPDFVPIIGYVDDVAVVMFVMKTGVHRDLDKYRKWKDEQNKKEIKNHAINISHNILKVIGDDFLAAVILCKDKWFKLLCSETKSQTMPIECRVIRIPVPDDSIKYFDEDNKEEIIGLLKQAVSEMSDCWVENAKKTVYLESEFDELWDEYIIEEVSDESDN